MKGINVVQDILHNYGYLTTYAYDLCHDKYKTDQMVQDTLIKCWVNKDKLDLLLPGEVKAYTKRILYNVLQDSYHINKRNLGIVDLDDIFYQPCSNYNVLNHLEAKETLFNMVRLIFNKVRKKESSEAYILNRFYGLSFREIADKMGVSIDNVGAKVMRVNKLICKTKIKEYI